MGFNSRGDVFANGTSEGNPVTWLSPQQVAALPSGDFPGKTVGAVAPKQRKKDNYAGIKEQVASGGEIQPGTVQDGVLIDGHTRAAAHLELGKAMAVRATAATVHATKSLRGHLKERALAAYERKAAPVVDFIGKEMEANRPQMSQMLHNYAGPTSPLPRRTRP